MRPRTLVVLGVAALVCVFVLPPLGLLLGIVTLVLAARLMRGTRAQPQELLTPEGRPVTVKVAQAGRTNAVFALVLGIAATALGGLLCAMLIVLWPQVRDYSTCHDGVNTTQGEAKCKQEFKDAVLTRFGR